MRKVIIQIVHTLLANRIWAIATVVALLAVLTLLFSNYGFVKRIDLENQIAVLNEDIKAEKQISTDLKRTANRLRNDSTEIERIAREKYGMIKQGETVYVIEQMADTLPSK